MNTCDLLRSVDLNRSNGRRTVSKRFGENLCPSKEPKGFRVKLKNLQFFLPVCHDRLGN